MLVFGLGVVAKSGPLPHAFFRGRHIVPPFALFAQGLGQIVEGDSVFRLQKVAYRKVSALPARSCRL